MSMADRRPDASSLAPAWSIAYGEEFSPKDARKYPLPMDQMVHMGRLLG